MSSGLPLEAVAQAMLIGENTGFAISPVIPSVYPTLANVELTGMVHRVALCEYNVGRLGACPKRPGRMPYA